MSRRSIYTWRKITMRIDITNFISIRCFTFRQPPRIHPPQRILVKVYPPPPRQPYRVLLRKPPSVRVVIPEQIVEVTGLPVGCPPSCVWRLLMTYSAESSNRLPAASQRHFSWPGSVPSWTSRLPAMSYCQRCQLAGYRPALPAPDYCSSRNLSGDAVDQDGHIRCGWSAPWMRLILRWSSSRLKSDTDSLLRAGWTRREEAGKMRAEGKIT